MSVSLLEVFESSGYNVNSTRAGAIWLLSKQLEFAELIEAAEELTEDI